MDGDVSIGAVARDAGGLGEAEIRSVLEKAVEGLSLKKVLIIPPDFTRFNSNAGLITQIYWQMFTA